MPTRKNEIPGSNELKLGLKEAEKLAPKKRKSAFDALGFRGTIEELCEDVRNLYLDDDVPWIVGYSGGKDSTATLQIIWLALEAMPAADRKKEIFVICTDTLVENPIVAQWVGRSLRVMGENAKRLNMPIVPKLLHPEIVESFWVNLIGKGYPAPRHKFRWCTERLKIRPSNRFISDVVTQNGEAILALGTRTSESVARARVMGKNRKYRVRDRLSPSATLAGCMLYTPIETWTNDDVWMFLTQTKNPWGHSNRDLLGMYAGASADGECPLVVDTTTPSCGDSRFGCWVCTLVEKDKSMTAMIQNDAEKEWMMPLLELRNELDPRGDKGDNPGRQNDHHLRDFRRMTGVTQLKGRSKKKEKEKGQGKEEWNAELVPGPYTQESRERWLRKLLAAQVWIRKNGPEEVSEIQLITLDELQEIRRIWVVDKHELEDSLPRIYREVTGEDYPGNALDDQSLLGAEEMAVLAELCGDDRLHFELTRELIGLTQQQQNSARRRGLYERLEKSVRKHFYDDEADALDRAKRRSAELKGHQVHDDAERTKEEGGLL